MSDQQDSRIFRDLEDRHRKLAADARDLTTRAQLLTIAEVYRELRILAGKGSLRGG